MKSKVKRLEEYGYEDMWYWDFRIVFEYKGKKYTYMRAGSASGWINKALTICHGVQSGIFDQRTEEDGHITEDEDIMIRAAEILDASGKKELCISEDWSSTPHGDLELRELFDSLKQ